MDNVSAATATGKRGPKVAEKDYLAPGESPRDSLQHEGDFVFAYTNGKEIRGNIRQFPEGIIFQLAEHGLMQRGGDAYASVKGDADLAYERTSKVIQQLHSGEWGATREGGGVGSALWMIAMARLKRWFLDADGDPTENPAFKANPDLKRVKSRVDEIEAGPDGEATLERIKKSDPVKAEVAKIQAERALEALRKAEAAGSGGGEEAVAAF